MQLTARRAELKDANQIQQIINHAPHKEGPPTHGNIQNVEFEKTLMRRYGDVLDFTALIDVSPFNLVVTDIENKSVFGFLALCNGPPEIVDVETKSEIKNETPKIDFRCTASGDWERFIKLRFECKDLQVHNTKFVSFFISTPENASHVLDVALSTAFNVLPQLKYICYTLPENIILFPPFSTPKFVPSETIQKDSQHPEKQQPAEKSTKTHHKKEPSNGNSKKTKHTRHKAKKRDENAKYFIEAPVKSDGVNFSLYICPRKIVVPVLKIRPGKVEDCDDLIPMMKRQNILQDKYGDFYLADLLESKNEASKTLVAEVDGDVVGFMNFFRDVDQKLLSNSFQLDFLDNLNKDIVIEAPVVENNDVVRIDPFKSSRKLSSATTNSQAPEQPAVQSSNPQLSKELISDPVTSRPDTAAPTDPDRPQTAKSESAAPPPKPQVPTVKNEVDEQPNAFCISLFCIEDQFANQAFEFVKSAFNIFPDRDYCVVTVPTTSPEIPMLRNFTLIQPRPGKNVKHCLYVTNRFAFGDHQLKVRRASKADLQMIESLIRGMSNEMETIIEVKQSISNDTDLPSHFENFVGEMDNQVVVLCVLETALDAKPLSDQFDLEEFITLRAHSIQNRPVILRRLIINPLFEPLARWFLEEVFRQGRLTCLFFPVDERTRNDDATRKVTLKEFIPIKRRRQLQYTYNLRDGSLVYSPLGHSLQILCQSMLYEPRVTVNTKICVIGGSDVGISFLEKLVYTTHLRFTNLTLISIDGPPARDEKYPFFVNNKCFSDVELKQNGLEQHVRVISELTTEFDRIGKRLKLTDGTYLSYDFLILTPGFQFFASSISEELAALEGVYSLNRKEGETLSVSMDKFSIHSEVLDGNAIVYVRISSEFNVILNIVTRYGKDIQAYATVQGLLGKSVPPIRIKLVIPPTTLPTTCFNNNTIEEKMSKVLEHLGVEVYRNYKLKSWDSTSGSISSIVLMRKEDKSEIVVDRVELFLYADEKTIDHETFKCINDSCLVYDGRLVIDKYFRTQDPFIYAAGSATKYSSKYQTPWYHGYYDSKEIGIRLAETILSLFDPLASQNNLVDDNELVRFTMAKKSECYLPGNFYYFHFDKPRLPSHTLEWRRKQPNYGRDLILDGDITGNKTNGYFRIHIDPLGYINSLTYLGIRPIPTDNLLALYGMHERYLNQLVSRFDEGIITDFIDFFEEGWVLPLVHDRFQAFAKWSRINLLTQKLDGEMEKVIQRLHESITAGEKIGEEERKNLYQIFDKSPQRKHFDQLSQPGLSYNIIPTEQNIYLPKGMTFTGVPVESVPSGNSGNVQQMRVLNNTNNNVPANSIPTSTASTNLASSIPQAQSLLQFAAIMNNQAARDGSIPPIGQFPPGYNPMQNTLMRAGIPYNVQLLPQQVKENPSDPGNVTNSTATDGNNATEGGKGKSQGKVGSEEWLKQRRENHKEVERKRRDAINEGIQELGRLVPDGEKNKSRIIMRAVQYINELKMQESANLEKWTLEKLMCEQAIQELSVQNESYSRELKYYHEQCKKLGAENYQLKEELELLRREITEKDQSRKRTRED